MICQICHTEGPLSQSMPYCPTCIREKFKRLYPKIRLIHEQTRKAYNLPVVIPDDEIGKRCRLCVNSCRVHEGAYGFCGVRENVDGKISGPDKTWAYVSWYHDPLPTNCVADWVCAGSKDYGYNNLAVFYQACTFNCLFCQNWHYRNRKAKATTQELIRAADPTTGCICFFGGDPTPFAMHSCEVAKQILEKKRKFRICWETNGSISPNLMRRWAEYSLKSNGCIKIDFKTYSEELNIALCGTSNKNTKENIKLVAGLGKKRKGLPLLIVSTLLIPGYIDEYELEQMARFISSINKNIPWSFLGFFPHFYFSDMPRTSRKQADMALTIAEDYGIENTHVGNIHLLI